MSGAVLLALGLLFAGPRATALARQCLERLGTRPGDRAGNQEALLAELTALGLSAGLGLAAALEAAAAHLSRDAVRDVRRALRTPGRIDDANVAKGLLALASRSMTTGAPLLASIEGYAMTLRRNERAAAVERARRLPVKLLFPLTLLILPGFLVLTVGPALLAGADRLGF